LDVGTVERQLNGVSVIGDAENPKPCGLSFNRTLVVFEFGDEYRPGLYIALGIAFHWQAADGLRLDVKTALAVAKSRNAN
jgi:hypothetical protein